MAGVIVASWRYLENDSAIPPRVTTTTPGPEESGAPLMNGKVESSATASPSHGSLADGALPAGAPQPSTEVPATNSRFEQRQMLERLGFDAAKEGVEAALQKLSQVTGGAERVAFLRGMFTHLSEDPEEALRAVKSLAIGIDRETAVAALVASWQPEPLSLDDQSSLTKLYGSIGGMLARLSGDPELAAKYANELLRGMDRARLLGLTSGNLAASDPHRAMTLGAELTGQERAEFLVGLVTGWARTDADAAWTWALQQADPTLRNSLQDRILESWAYRDPAKAASMVPQISQAETRQKLLRVVAESWAGVDTKAAFDWANNLSTPQERETANAAVRQGAPVGIGVVLAEGPDGYPLIRELVPGSTASSSGTLQSGYQIAAVGNGNGQFTELHGKNIADVAPMIRGKPGSSVWLQVIPPGGAPGSRVTVVVPRQQLMFKKPPG